MCKAEAAWKAACILARIKYGHFFASARCLLLLLLLCFVWRSSYLWFCFSVTYTQFQMSINSCAAENVAFVCELFFDTENK